MQQAVEYRRKGLVSGGVLLELLVGTQLGFAVMLVSLLLGMPSWATVMLMVGTIAAVLFVCSAEISYIVDADGITRAIEPKVLHYTSLARRDFVPWSRIASYTLDYDRNRSWQTYPYLLILGTRPRVQWKIAGTSMQDAAFEGFVDGFVRSISASEAAPDAAAKAAVVPPITRRPGFYATKRAKVLACALVAIDVLIIAGVWTETLHLSQAGMYRLVAVLLPGTLYILYRTLRH